MPKRRDPGRSTPPRQGEPARTEDPTKLPPDQAEVERAIRSVVERLKPKPGKDKPARKTRRAALASSDPGIR